MFHRLILITIFILSASLHANAASNKWLPSRVGVGIDLPHRERMAYEPGTRPGMLHKEMRIGLDASRITGREQGRYKLIARKPTLTPEHAKEFITSIMLTSIWLRNHHASSSPVSSKPLTKKG